jgi:hypothetical protein
MSAFLRRPLKRRKEKIVLVRANDQDEDSSTIPPLLGMEQLICLGKDCGFEDKDEGEFSEAANQTTYGA